jgi:crotonobetainyl-CoA:carnitine CoA-transferase CaiB-like acyl-CoA transferase
MNSKEGVRMSENEVMLKKAFEAQLVLDDLKKRLGIETTYPITFVVAEGREQEFLKACAKENPFPGILRFVLTSLRKKGVKRLFENETVVQTPVVAAVLSLCSSLATEIGALRGIESKDAQIYCDVAYAGEQAIRLYLVDQKDKAFKKARSASAVRVDNALNGSFYKYETKDGRKVSFHVYYQSQQKKLVAALKLKKESSEFKFLSTRKDRRYLAKVMKNYTAAQLEELAFSSGACGCLIRSREEWESSAVGKAVCAMPLITFKDAPTKGKPTWEVPDPKKGPLSGIKVLDLTHIIAGPACSRILAEYGADVLLVRRGKFIDQEQAMLELDGWAGKNSIQLDLNHPDDLARIKELIKEADVITYSYQNGCFDKFGLSPEEIRKLNPAIIYADLNCFSDSEWKTRPGWAPLAEDITGLSVRNGSLQEPKNLNGVPLDYIPGFILALGTLIAIKRKLKDGTSGEVYTSLTRGAEYLHEATDFCAKNTQLSTSSKIADQDFGHHFDGARIYVESGALGSVGFPRGATYNTLYPHPEEQMGFADGQSGFKKE